MTHLSCLAARQNIYYVHNLCRRDFRVFACLMPRCVIPFLSDAAPGGIIIQDGDPYKTNTCVFGLATDMEKVRAFEQVFVKLMRR